MFHSVKYKKFYSDFYYNNKVAKESVIESVYHDLYKDCVGKAIKIKKIFCKKGITDGVIEFLHPKTKKHLGWGVQEVKRGFRNNSPKFEHQIIQSLAYSLQLNPESKIDVIILNSEKFFDYLFIDDNKEIIQSLKEEILSKLNYVLPSKMYKHMNIDLNKFKIIHYDLNDNFDLKEPMTDIYLKLLTQ